MRTLFALLICCFFVLPATQAQKAGKIQPDDLKEIQLLEDTMTVLSFLVVNDSIAQNRFAATHKLIKTLVKALKHDNSYSYKFPKLNAVSIQYAPDSTFRIFSWQLVVDPERGEYRHYGAIQMNQSALQLFPLIDRSFELNEEPSTVTLSNDRWYGALYYRIMKLERPQGDAYLLFGMDGYSFYRRRKLMEVMTFGPDGQPVFGQEAIIPRSDDQLVNRLVLEYSADASIRLNYDEQLEMIIFDHLIEMQGRYGEGPVNVSDGSYEGFTLKKGALDYTPKVFNQVSEEAPRPMPVFGAEGSTETRDILGRKSKKKN